MLTMIFAAGSPSLPTFKHQSLSKVVEQLEKYHAFYGNRRFIKRTFASHIKGRTRHKAREYGTTENILE